MEQALVAREGIRYAGIDTGQLRGKNPLTTLSNAGKMIAGVRQSRAIVEDLRPDVCFVTGGYVCAPVVVACRMRRVPVLIYLPDMVPGSAIRTLSRLAQRVAVTFPEAAAYFGGLAPQGKAVVTGYPVREELVVAAQDRARARQALARSLELPLDGPGAALPLLLVWGGSQGSRSINRAAWSALPTLLPHAHVLHVIGARDWEMAQPQLRALDARLTPELRQRYYPFAYLHDAMPLALAAADLTVARAGASTLGEFPVAGLPSVLAPLPLAGVNQAHNAEQLARHGAARIVQDAALETALGPAVLELLTHPEELAAMGLAAAQLAQPDAAQRIADELLALATAAAEQTSRERSISAQP
jgi:UDP-N-acetylglucosamine--N-acetylmuramyl-(pentapeptide) pyrophosphoryl-undecaprenol N-acetylglucosamine transferase